MRHHELLFPGEVAARKNQQIIQCPVRGIKTGLVELVWSSGSPLALALNFPRGDPLGMLLVNRVNRINRVNRVNANARLGLHDHDPASDADWTCQ